MSRPEVDGLNAGYAALLLEQYLDNPSAVPSEWRALFESAPEELLAIQPGLARLLERLERNGGNGHAPVAEPPPVPEVVAPAVPTPPPAAPPPPDDELIGGVAAAMSLVKAHRTHGHLAARLDPLGSEPHGDPALEPERLIPKLTAELMARIPAPLLRLYVEGETLADVYPRLREIYCGSIAYEIEHISDHEERVWLRQAIESGRYRLPLSSEEKVSLLGRLSQIEGMERYLRRAFLGQKQFSIEGLDVMVPMLDEAIELGADTGAHEVVIGMAHRGRLNVLAHVVGRPYEVILREFEGERTIEAVVVSEEGGSGDVKYHLGAEGTRTTRAGEITVTLASNPSHLEAVDPVVEGRARAEQTDRSTREGYHDPTVALPILIHGDASFAGQGEVAETLNLEGLAGYSTGGTLHLIANNQVGFTTDPADGRSTRYSSDLAKGFDIPIIHVNADDPEAALAAVRLALAYRRRFGHDVVVDLVGYRRHGHNEQDEAAYTQPLLAAAIAQHPTVRELYAEQLVEADIISSEQAEALDRQVLEQLKSAHEALKETFGSAPRPTPDGRIPAGTLDEVMTAVPAEKLHELNEQLLRVPDWFSPHPKLMKQLERRRDQLEGGGIDWGQAEALAFGIAPRRRNPHSHHGPGHRARHVLASSRSPARREHGRDVYADAAPRRGGCVVRDPQLSALRVRLPRLRVRLFGCSAGSARALGSAVRRLRQRRADHRRPVHRRRPLEVGRDVTPHAPAPSRVRRQRAGAFERATRTVPAARGAGEHPDREPHDLRAVFPPRAQAGARRHGASAHRDDAEGLAAAEAGVLEHRGSGRRRVPAGDRRRDRGS